jgi:glycogen(starch) synthase
LLDLNYYEAMQGSHFGVFPSFYEPWGYTPLEAGALGVASVTTDLAGFGRFALQQKGDDPKGVFVIKRMGKQEDEATDELAKLLYYFTKLQKKKRVENKIEARRLANLADWDILINNYINAQNMAIDKVFSQ